MFITPVVTVFAFFRRKFSHSVLLGCPVALGMAILVVGCSTILVQAEMTQQLLNGLSFSLVQTFTKLMNPNDFGDLLTFYLAPPAVQSFYLSSEISEHLLDGLAQNVVQIVIEKNS